MVYIDLIYKKIYTVYTYQFSCNARFYTTEFDHEVVLLLFVVQEAGHFNHVIEHPFRQKNTREVSNGKREKAFLPHSSHPPRARSFFPLPASLSETKRRNIILARTQPLIIFVFVFWTVIATDDTYWCAAFEIRKVNETHHVVKVRFFFSLGKRQTANGGEPACYVLWLLVYTHFSSLGSRKVIHIPEFL